MRNKKNSLVILFTLLLSLVIPNVAKADISDVDFFEIIFLILAIIFGPSIIALIILFSFRHNLRIAIIINFGIFLVNILFLSIVQMEQMDSVNSPDINFFYLAMPITTIFFITMVSYTVVDSEISEDDELT